MSARRPDRVRELVQVYLDRQDLTLLDRLAEQTGLAKAEILRRGLRRLATTDLGERAPGWSHKAILGILGDDPDYPPDYSARHDEYLARAIEEKKPRGRRWWSGAPTKIGSSVSAISASRSQMR